MKSMLGKVIFSPNIDKNWLKRYNNIVINDYLGKRLKNIRILIFTYMKVKFHKI